METPINIVVKKKGYYVISIYERQVEVNTLYFDIKLLWILFTVYYIKGTQYDINVEIIIHIQRNTKTSSKPILP